MKRIIVSLLFFTISTLCNAQTFTVVVDTNNLVMYPTNGFAALTLNGDTITQWQSPTSGMSQVTADLIYIRKDGTNGAMTGILTNTAGFSGNIIGNVTGTLTGNVTGNLIGNVTNSVSTKIEIPSHGIQIDTNGISLW